MRHQTVEDLMTVSVVRVRPGTPFKEIARLFVERDITAVPVVDEEGRPIGVVSEADLLCKEEAQLDPAGHLPVPHLPPGDEVKATASAAEGLMTSPAIIARPRWSAVEATQAMARHHVKSLPVVDDAGRLVGIITRHDLVKVFLREDLAIRDEIVGEVLTRTLGADPGMVGVHVSDGRVTLSGTMERRSLIPVAVRLCGSVDGVVEVVDRMDYTADDTATEAAPAR